MVIERFNSEGYFDPTAYEAMSNVEKEEQPQKIFRPVVYICSPYAGDVEANVASARRFSRFAVECGYIPIAPHLLFPQFLNDDNPDERQLGRLFGNVMMSKCSEIWVFAESLCGSKHISSGMDAEIKRARRKGYRIRYFTTDFKEFGDE